MEHEIARLRARKERRRRDRHEIISDILEYAKTGKIKTRIMQKIRLSYPQLELYLNAMLARGFLKKVGSDYVTTRKGLHVVEACKMCFELSRLEEQLEDKKAQIK